MKQTVYQIDQSGKIEHTNKHTVITLANGHTFTLRISAVEKRKLIKIMLELDYPKLNYMQKTFAALIFILIKDAKLHEIIIDKEYPEHEADIKNMLIDHFKKWKIKPPEIYFGLIGKRANAHIYGIATYRERRKPNFIVKTEDLLKLMYGKIKEKRLEIPVQPG